MSPFAASRDHVLAPTHTRWNILALLTLISVITYVDRVNISVAARQMMPAMGLTQLQMGYVFSAFVLGYALFQIPGGWLGDRWGSRLVLTLAVVWWSFFTACTALAGTLPTAQWLGILGSLLLVRFLIGVGEAAALPNFNRSVANWFPLKERGLGMGVSIGGIGLGSAVTPPIVAWMMVNYGWQSAFYAAALAGFAIALLWGWYARDRPESKKEWGIRMEAPEVNMTAAVSAKALPRPRTKPAIMPGTAAGNKICRSAVPLLIPKASHP